MKYSKVTGYIFIVAGLLLNELTIKWISGYETKFATADKSIILIIVELFIILVGVYILRKGKTAIQNLLLAFFSIIIFFVLLEIILSIFYQNNIYDDHPIFIPLKYKELNWEINEVHIKKTGYNHYGFNDINHSYEKPSEIDHRIAVLGDSFIWGDGVEDSVIWINQLQTIYLSNNCNLEILNWGKPGWSTVDQLNFLKKEGIKYKFDLLIFAFVLNDIVTDSTDARLLLRPDGFVARNIQRIVGTIFPNSISFIVDLLNNFFETYFDYGYTKWLQRLYSENNFNKYDEFLFELNNYCKQNEINFVFVLTPENNNILLKDYFDKITQVMDKHKITYINLFPDIHNKFKHYSSRRLWANPANGHPGYLVTKELAKSTYKFLNNLHYFFKCQNNDSALTKNQKY